MNLFIAIILARCKLLAMLYLESCYNVIRKVLLIYRQKTGNYPFYLNFKSKL